MICSPRPGSTKWLCFSALPGVSVATLSVAILVVPLPTVRSTLVPAFGRSCRLHEGAASSSAWQPSRQTELEPLGSAAALSRSLSQSRTETLETKARRSARRCRDRQSSVDARELAGGASRSHLRPDNAPASDEAWNDPCH